MLTRAAHRLSIQRLTEVHYPAPHREEISAGRGEVPCDDFETSPSRVFFSREWLHFAHGAMMSFDFLSFKLVWLCG